MYSREDGQQGGGFAAHTVNACNAAVPFTWTDLDNPSFLVDGELMMQACASSFK
jgi:hypothetical protein